MKIKSFSKSDDEKGPNIIEKIAQIEKLEKDIKSERKSYKILENQIKVLRDQHVSYYKIYFIIPYNIEGTRREL